MNDINFIAVIIATIISFGFGALWYSPLMFIKPWSSAAGVDPDNPVDNPAQVYPITALVTLLSVAALAWLLGGNPELASALTTALVIGVGLVAASLATNYQFAGQSLVHWVIDSGFHVVRLLLVAATLALWP